MRLDRQQLLESDWKLPHTHTGGVIDGVGNRSRGADIAEFADAPELARWITTSIATVILRSLTAGSVSN
jgi:hypothetical protein